MYYKTYRHIERVLAGREVFKECPEECHFYVRMYRKRGPLRGNVIYTTPFHLPGVGYPPQVEKGR